MTRAESKENLRFSISGCDYASASFPASECDFDGLRFRIFSEQTPHACENSLQTPFLFPFGTVNDLHCTSPSLISDRRFSDRWGFSRINHLSTKWRHRGHHALPCFDFHHGSAGETFHGPLIILENHMIQIDFPAAHNACHLHRISSLVDDSSGMS